MRQDFERQLNDLEALQRQGKSRLVGRAILQLEKKKIPLRWRVPLADLARRAGYTLASLKILNVGRDPMYEFSSDSERLCYAAGLFALGNFNEAVKRLDGIKSPQLRAEGDFYYALALMRRWDYHSALSRFAKYRAGTSMGEYRQLVLEINELACLIAVQQFNDVFAKIKSLRQRLKQAKAKLLLFNLIELEAQAMFLSGHSAPSSPEFELDEAPANYRLFVRKWQTLAQIQKLELASFRDKIRELRAEAVAQGHWETLRDLDYYELKKTKDSQTFTRLYLGTPFATFRHRLEALNLKLSETIDLGPLESFPVEIDLNVPFNTNKMNMRLLRALLKDLYRPTGLGELFEAVHPQERFNPDTSPSRLKRALQRLNQWLKTKKWGLRVQIQKGNYKLIFSRRVLIKSSHLQATPWPLAQMFGERWFRVRDLIAHSSLSERSIRRHLARLVQEGYVETQGATHYRSYRLKPRRN